MYTRPAPTWTDTPANPHPTTSNTNSTSSSHPGFPVVEDATQALACGRIVAKQMLQPVEWTPLPPPSTPHFHRVDVFACHSEPDPLRVASDARLPLHTSLRTFRAVRRLRGVLQDVETVLAATYQSGMFATVLPQVYAAGGCLADFGILQHPTNEREHANLQFAELRAFSLTTPRAAPIERHLFLEYSLITTLQRTVVHEGANANDATATSDVPSLLYVLRQVDVPSFRSRHPEFAVGDESGATSAFAIVFMIQETADPEELQLEAMIVCAVPAVDEGDFCAASPSEQITSMLQDRAIALTRIQPMVDEAHMARLAREIAVPKPKPKGPRSTHSDTRSRGSSTKESKRHRVLEFFKGSPQRETRSTTPRVTSSETAHGCALCFKRFHAFRWKKRCEICHRGVCEECVSKLAIPGIAHKKKRVCNHCLFESTRSAPFHVPNAAKIAEASSERNSRGRAPTTPLPTRRATEQYGRVRSLSTGITNSRSEHSEHSSDLDASVDSFIMHEDPVVERRRTLPANLATLDLPSPPPLRLADLQDSSIPETEIHSRFWNDTDAIGIASDDECNLIKRNRRAKIDTKPKPHAKPRPKYRRRSFSGDRDTPADLQNFTLQLSEKLGACMPTPTTSTLQLRQFKTPPANYDLSFSWVNPFPKAPIAGADKEHKRVEYITHNLRLNTPRAMVELRHDATLEELAHKALADIATEWHGCSIHLVASHHVVCIAYSTSCDVCVDDEALNAIVAESVPREESPSSHAVYHKAPFFVADLGTDPRFQAHPLHTDASVCSYLSLPIYVRGRWCVGTLDLWTIGPDVMRSEVSHEWWKRMEQLLVCIADRVEQLSTANASRSPASRPSSGRAFSPCASPAYQNLGSSPAFQPRSFGSAHGSYGASPFQNSPLASPVHVGLGSSPARKSSVASSDHSSLNANPIDESAISSSPAPKLLLTSTSPAHKAANTGSCESSASTRLADSWDDDLACLEQELEADAIDAAVSAIPAALSMHARPRRHTVTEKSLQRVESLDEDSTAATNTYRATESSVTPDLQITIEELLQVATHTSQLLEEQQRTSERNGWINM